MINYNIYKSLEDETDKWILKVEVVEANPIPNEIFLFHTDINENEVYKGVASINAIIKYPTSPVEGECFFRKDNFELTFDTLKNLNDYLDSMNVIISCLESDYCTYITDEVLMIL